MGKFKPVPPKAPKRVGNIANAEKQFIADNIRTLGLEQTARKLQRSVKVVKNLALGMGIKIDDSFAETDILYQQIEEDLRKSPEYRNLRHEFTKREIKYFAHRYAKHLAQFREDVTTTEQTQVFQAIRYEILMQRISGDIKSSLREKKRLELMIQRFWRKWNSADPPKEEVELLAQIQTEINNIRAGEVSRTSELVKCQERHASLLKDLTATRAQRRDALNAAKDDIVGLIKMLGDEKFRKQESDQLQLVKLAVEKETQRLAAEHKFIDGSIDLPILTSENLEALDKLHEQEEKEEEKENE